MDRHRRLTRRHSHHRELFASSVAQLQNERRQRCVTGDVQRVHGRRGAVASLWVAFAGVADCCCERDYAGVGDGYFGDEGGVWAGGAITEVYLNGACGPLLLEFATLPNES